ncbi:hypothetical protein JTB14_017096 [Gonioctena quinquepunctata]|nr:hypothetical protein JTB14_017096 [Gonioctena quinquepunctata]
MYLSFRIFFIIFILWAVVPEEWLWSIGITFLPQRYWAVAVPIYFLTLLTIFAFVIYPGLGLYMTPDIDDLKTITDSYGNKLKCNRAPCRKQESILKCVCKNEDGCSREYYGNIRGTLVHKSIPVLQDLEMWDVSDNLYLR